MYDSFIMQLYYLWLDVETFFVGFWTLINDHPITSVFRLVTDDMGAFGDGIQWVIDNVFELIKINGESLGTYSIIDLLFSSGLTFLVVLILAKFFISIFK